jgi:hypothetical protein
VETKRSGWMDGFTQSSLLGPRTPEDVVRSMISGLVVLLHSPDDESVADATITLRNLMCEAGTVPFLPPSLSPNRISVCRLNANCGVMYRCVGPTEAAERHHV